MIYHLYFIFLFARWWHYITLCNMGSQMPSIGATFNNELIIICICVYNDFIINGSNIQDGHHHIAIQKITNTTGHTFCN
jgi:hypothetical protein